MNVFSCNCRNRIVTVGGTLASNTTIKGEIASLKVDLRSIEKGFVSSKPVYECPYDRVLEKTASSTGFR